MVRLGIKPLYRAVVDFHRLETRPESGLRSQAVISLIVRSASSSLSIYIDKRWLSSTRVPAMSTTLSRSSAIWITLFSWALPKWACYSAGGLGLSFRTPLQIFG